MAKRQDRINTARIQRAVTGFQIPIMSIGALNRALENSIGEGATDDELRDVVRVFLAVQS